MNIELLNRIERVLGEAWSEAARKASADSRKKRGPVGKAVHKVKKRAKDFNKNVASAVDAASKPRKSFNKVIHKLKNYLHK